MKWKDIKLIYKLFIAFGLLVFLILFLTIYVDKQISLIIKDGKEAIYGSNLNRVISESKLAHLKWSDKLHEFLSDDHINKLDLETNPHQCAFGKWYYSDNRKMAEKQIPELKHVFENIEAPHEKLHASAIQIQKIFKQANRNFSIFALNSKNQHIEWLKKLEDAIALHKNSLTINLDPDKCALGQWLNNEQTKTFINNNPEYLIFYEKLKDPHDNLHKSGKIIEKNLLSGNFSQAQKIFNNQTKVYANEIISNLDKIIELNNNRIEKMNLAYEIYIEKSKPALVQIENNLDRAREIISDNEISDDVMVQNAQKTRSTLLIIAIIIIIVALFISYFLSMNINKQIYKGLFIAEEISRGNLSVQTDINQKDEIGQLIKALINMNHKLKEIIGNIVRGANSIATLSDELSNTSQSMAEGNHEQSASAEEISATIEELTSTSEQNSNNAIETKAIAKKSAEEINTGAKAVLNTVNAMKIIADKIAVINEIANKTNMLALNAAVEAARAGKKGKGFAVVAAQIKELADKSHLAANEIEKVSAESVQIAENTINIFKSIVPDIEKTAILVEEIANSSQEQSSSTNQIATSVEQFNEVTQKNAASAEELATSSEELASQAEFLKNTVNYFKVDKTEMYSIQKKQFNDSSINKQKLDKPVKINKTKGYKFDMETTEELDTEFEKY